MLTSRANGGRVKPKRSVTVTNIQSRDKANAYVLALLNAIYETILETPDGAPGSMLYLPMVHAGLSFDQFEQLMGTLVMTGKVTKRHDCYFPG